MRRILLLLIILALCLLSAACSYTASDPPELFHVGVVDGDAMILRFYLRNVSDATFHYNGGFTLYRLEDRQWNYNDSLDSNPQQSGYIAPGLIKNYTYWFAHAIFGLDWRGQTTPDEHRANEREPGRYMFVKRLFPDSSNTDIFEYLRIEFDISCPDEPLEDHMDWHYFDVQRRRAHVEFALRGLPSRIIVPEGEIEISRSEIRFDVRNHSAELSSFPTPFAFAVYNDGYWSLAPESERIWTRSGFGYDLQGGGVMSMHEQWFFPESPSQLAGEPISPGRYKFIRNFWTRYSEYVGYIIVEFTIDEDTPLTLATVEHPRYVALVEYRDITPTGMIIVFENVSDFGFSHRAFTPMMLRHSDGWEQIIDLREGYFFGFLEYFIMEGYLPVGGRFEYRLDWTDYFGVLPPDRYKLRFILDGYDIPPPHPTGWMSEWFEIEFTIE